MWDEDSVIELGSDTDSDEWEEEEARNKHSASQYNQEQRDVIQEIVVIGFPEQMVIAALEITNFSKLKAINLLLANEETKRRWNWEIGYELAPKKVNRNILHNMAVTADKKIEARELESTSRNLSDTSKEGKWRCSTCTFENLSTTDHCEMCTLQRKDVVTSEEREYGEQDVMAPIAAEDEPVFEPPGAQNQLVKPIEKAKPKLHIQSPQLDVFAKKANVGKLCVTLNTVVGLKHGARYCVLTLEGKQVKSRQLEKSKTLEFNEVFHFRGFSLDAKRKMKIRLMDSNWFFSDSVIGQALYALPTAFNRHFRDCVPLTNSKNTTVGFLMISAVILEQKGSGEFGWR